MIKRTIVKLDCGIVSQSCGKTKQQPKKDDIITINGRRYRINVTKKSK